MAVMKLGRSSGFTKGYTAAIPKKYWNIVNVGKKLRTLISHEHYVTSTGVDGSFFATRGDSGSAVVNTRGEFIGMVFSINLGAKVQTSVTGKGKEKEKAPVKQVTELRTAFMRQEELFEDIKNTTGYSVDHLCTSQPISSIPVLTTASTISENLPM